MSGIKRKFENSTDSNNSINSDELKDELKNDNEEPVYKISRKYSTNTFDNFCNKYTIYQDEILLLIISSDLYSYLFENDADINQELNDDDMEQIYNQIVEQKKIICCSNRNM
jgi:hypothetical protein